MSQLKQPKKVTFTNAPARCRIISYLSVVGFTLSLINIDEIIGFTFIVSVASVIILVRWSWNQGLSTKPIENDFD